MKRQARPHAEADNHVLCPFCDHPCQRNSRSSWCQGCGAAWEVVDGKVIFDSEKKADRQTLIRALAEQVHGGRATDRRGAERRRPVRLRKKG